MSSHADSGCGCDVLAVFDTSALRWSDATRAVQCVSGRRHLIPRSEATHHGVGEGRWDRNNHPPHQAFRKSFSFSLHKTAHQLAIQLGHIETNQRPQYEEHRVAPQQPELCTLPPRHAYSQQFSQAAEELSVQFYLLPPCRFCLLLRWSRARSSTPSLSDSCSCGFLLFDCIAYAIRYDEEECEIDTARNARSVGYVQGRKVVQQTFQRACRTRLSERQRVCGHDGRALAEERDMEWTAMRLYEDSRKRRCAAASMSMTFSKPSRLSLVVSRHSHAQQLQPPPRFPSHSPTSFKGRAGI